MKFLALLAIIFLVRAEPYGDVIKAGYDVRNTRDFPSVINKNNVDKLVLKWNATMCGAATATPLIYGDRACISDFGTCYTCFNKDTGAIIFQKSLSTDYGFPLDLYARGMPTYDIDSGLVIMATTNIGSLLANGGPGTWVFAVRFDDGSLAWKSQVTNFSWAIITDSPLLYRGHVYFGISSTETSEVYLDPGAECCKFVGTFYKYKVSNGELIWATEMIPPYLQGVGKFAGCGIWGSTPALGADNDVYFGTGELYSTPANVSACSTANPLNQSCVPAAIHLDSVIRVDLTTGAIRNSFRAMASDTWNIACLLNQEGIPFPGCVSVAIAYDFDITAIQYSKKTNTVYAGSKSGYKWGFTQNLTYRWAKAIVPGSEIGGYSWQGALRDDKDLKHISVFGASSNGNNDVFTLPNGTNATSGVFTRYDGNGNLKWAVVPPNRDQVYGGVTITNDVFFGQTKVYGLLVAVNIDSGDILWTFQTLGAMNGAPAIVEDRIYWPTGAGNDFGGENNQRQFLTFELEKGRDE
jgi:polyvinyl alcohol dehydrogenase (cytochrome)